MWTVPKIWKDERCFIIGGGASFTNQLGIPKELVTNVREQILPASRLKAYLEPFTNNHTIGVNMALTMGATFIDILFFGDVGFWTRRKHLIQEFNGLKVTCANPFPSTPGIKLVGRDRSKNLGLCDNSKKVCWNGNSGGAAINFAVHTGVKQIILLGFDMTSETPEIHHWHKYYGVRSMDKQNRTYATHLRCFPAIAEDAKKLGIEILNANPNSAIESFPKVTLKEVL